MKRSPFIAIVLALVLALYLYKISVRPQVQSVKVEASISDQIQDALSKIQSAADPQTQMKGVLQMRSLSEKYPENTDLQWNMGLFSMQSGQYKKAVERFENVIRLDDQKFDAYMQLALSYLALQDTTSSRTTLMTLIEKSEGEIKNRADLILEKLTNY